MSKARILLKLVLDETGLGDLELKTFDERLELQKKIYLLQLTGLDMRYRYNWYLYGPYCPELTKETFLLKEELDSGNEDFEGFRLGKGASELINRAREIYEVPEGLNVRDQDWLELLASIHYLKHIAWPTKNRGKSEIFERLLKAKPRFEGQELLMEAAWKRLSQLGLLERKTLN